MNSATRSKYGEEARFVGNSEDDRNCRSVPDPAPSHDLAHSFQRLNNLDNGAFERVGRYETALWRQVVQLMFVLQPRRRRKKRDIGPPF